MDGLMPVLRVVHILAGVYWVGSVFYFITLLAPAVRDAGPEGGKVMQALIRRRQLEILPAVAIVTVGSGLWLLWIVSLGFDRTWLRSPPAHTLLLGMVTAIAALLVGLFGMRPVALRLGPMMQAAMQAPEGPEREARLAAARGAQRRMQMMSRLVGGLLVVAVVTMAVFRYV